MRRRWIVAWLGGALIGVANGVLRESTYGRRLDERTSNQISALSAVAAFAAYFWSLQRRWPIPSTAEALRIGGIWLVLTIGFEFGFGRLVGRKSWRELLSDYDLARGRTWPLVLAWLAAGPAVTRKARATHADR